MRFTAAVLTAALPVLTALPAFAAPADDVRAAFTKFNALNSFEATVGGKSGKQTVTLDIVKPNSAHITGNGMELVRIGTTTYMHMGGAWRKMSAGVSDIYGSFNISNRLPDVGKDTTATDLGMKSMGGQMFHAYKIVDKNGTSTVYVGADGLPHVIDNAAGTHMTLSKFNAVPPISAPM